MSNTRIFWIAWCCFWALAWLLLGFFLIFPWIFVPFSLLAILLPVGRGPGEHTININYNKNQPPPPQPGMSAESYHQWLRDQGPSAS